MRIAWMLVETPAFDASPNLALSEAVYNCEDNITAKIIRVHKVKEYAVMVTRQVDTPVSDI